MTPYLSIADDFLDDFDAWRQWLDVAPYETVTNPADGVDYPGICRAVPMRGEVEAKLEKLMGRPVSVRYMFMRLSLEGVPVPHQAHTDDTMGQYSLMVYLNRPEHCRGGTSILRHVSGMETTPETPAELAAWQRDTNNPRQWEYVTLCPMRSNRACVFQAKLFHRAEPLGGFGRDATDGRLVLTAFFDA